MRSTCPYRWPFLPKILTLGKKRACLLLPSLIRIFALTAGSFKTMTKAEIQFVKSLSDKRVRDRCGVFTAEGRKLVGEILASGFTVRRLYYTDSFADFAFGDKVSEREMERISHLKTPSDCLAVVDIPRYRLRVGDVSDSLVLALDRVQNPGNLGTIIRLADWFGIGDVVCSEDCADCYNPKVVQATMGAILRVRVHYTDLPLFLGHAREAGMPVYGTMLDGENIYSAALSPSGVVVMGNEGAGLGEPVVSQLSHRLFIPPFPAHRAGSESLNVAVATAVACSEFRRRTY